MESSLHRSGSVFLGALLLHTADHLRRGLGSVPVLVQIAGNVQLALAAVTVLVAWRRPTALATWAIVLGFGSAVGFTSSHLLPDWGAFSDAFVGTDRGSGVAWFSWVTAVAEIGAGVWFGVSGLRARADASATPGVSAIRT